jgi:chromosome transmission fidelity protein 18
VRQVLDQELHKTLAQKESAARQARLRSGGPIPQGHAFDNKENINLTHNRKPELHKTASVAGTNTSSTVKRDFFGRVIVVERPTLGETDGNAAGTGRRRGQEAVGERGMVWVTYNEGMNNAVRKPVSLEEFLRGF